MTRLRIALVVGAGTAVCAATIAPAYAVGVALHNLWTPSTPLLFIPIVALVSSFGTGGRRRRPPGPAVRRGAAGPG